MKRRHITALDVIREDFSRNVCGAAAAKSLQSCPTLCDPMECSLPGSSVCEIFQARVLEWGANAFSARQHWESLVNQYCTHADLSGHCCLFNISSQM